MSPPGLVRDALVRDHVGLVGLPRRERGQNFRTRSLDGTLRTGLHVSAQDGSLDHRMIPGTPEHDHVTAGERVLADTAGRVVGRESGDLRPLARRPGADLVQQAAHFAPPLVLSPPAGWAGKHRAPPGDIWTARMQLRT